MPLAIRQLAAVAGHAAARILRAPVFCLILISALLLAGLLPALDYLSFLEKRRLVADSLLALSFCAGVFAAVAGAGSALGDQLRGGSASLVLSKPVSRFRFVAGQALGQAAALLPYWVCLGTAVLWGSRVAYHDYWPDTLGTAVYVAALAGALLAAAVANYLLRRPFGPTAVVSLAVLLPAAFWLLLRVGYRGHGSDGAALVDWHLLPAVALLYPALLLASAVALLASLWLDLAPAMLVTFGVFVAGLATDHLLSGCPRPAAAVAAGLLPSWQRLWVADALAVGVVPWDFVLRAGAAAIAQAVALVLVTVAVVERREVAGRHGY